MTQPSQRVWRLQAPSAQISIPSRDGSSPSRQGQTPGHHGTLTVEVLGCLPPQGLQAHLRVSPLQDQSPAVQVGAVTQGVEGSLGEQGQEMQRRVSGDLQQMLILSPDPMPAPQAQRPGSGPCDTCSPARVWELLGT